ncbi:MAG: ATP-binding protein [Desulfobacteraceae bacterium]|nr:ATP-binding protein [Desulfobacteraceae bacterium]MBC2757164.1 ATP-binding protein [Desulfobacteraceae bacterium]
MIPRLLYERINKKLFKGKAVIITGPRQSGKTTLIQHLAKNHQKTALMLNCDEPDIRQILSDQTSSQLKRLIGGVDLVLIDEAQRVRNIGVTLKLITDQIKDVQLIVTGSSSLELSNSINEPLTGRKFEFLLLPISTREMTAYTSALEERRLLENRLTFGMYPDIITQAGDGQDILHNLADSYLYKDIFTFQDIRKPELIEKLLQALALQLCSEVSFHELAGTLGVNSATVQRYIELLEKTFVIFRLTAFTRNLRNELKKSRKIYFYDNGIRNALIKNFNPVSLRPDAGTLWENFMISERKKHLIYNGINANTRFWRTRQQQEIDYIEEKNGKILAVEFKWNPKSTARFSKTFLNAYPGSETCVITPENYIEFLSE